jgi:hypothetical protein
MPRYRLCCAPQFAHWHVRADPRWDAAVEKKLPDGSVIEASRVLVADDTSWLLLHDRSGWVLERDQGVGWDELAGAAAEGNSWRKFLAAVPFPGTTATQQPQPQPQQQQQPAEDPVAIYTQLVTTTRIDLQQQQMLQAQLQQLATAEAQVALLKQFHQQYVMQAQHHRLMQLSKEELVERLLAAEGATAAVAVAAVPHVTASPAPAADTVCFRGQTLTRTNVAEVLRSEPHSGYKAGWICDGCFVTNVDVCLYHVSEEML